MLNRRLVCAIFVTLQIDRLLITAHNLHSRMKRYNLLNDIFGWVSFLIAAVTYLLTLEPTASFWDCPEFISQGAKLEVGHPPGNPIFMLAARFFVTIFGNNIANAAIAVNSMSALLSAATILLLFWTITHLIRRLIVADDAESMSWWQMTLIFAGGFCGALAYTWSDTFWFSAVEGEVYAFSSFCTALVFWLILKWENRADQPHSDRYLILIAYVIGVSIAVHLLNLLCIPAIVLVYYYKKSKNVSAKGSLIALLVSFVIVALILYGLVPGFVMVAQWFDLLFVNFFGLSYNMGVLIYAVLLVATFIWAIRSLYNQANPTAIKWSVFLSIVLSGMPFIGNVWIGIILTAALAIYIFFFCSKVPVRLFNIVVLSVFLIFIGYSSYALLLIRSNANTPMNQNAPDNVFALGSYLNREQYGERPLFSGAVFAEELEIISGEENGQRYNIVPVDESGMPRTRIVDKYLRDEQGAPYSDPKMAYHKVVKTSALQPDEYVENMSNPNYKEIPDLTMLLPRVYSDNPAHVQGYKGWSQYEISDLKLIPAELRRKWAEVGYANLSELLPYMTSQTVIESYTSRDGNPVKTQSVWKPGFGTNLRYFFNYQFSHMYWRYFMWNFAGRQNDMQGNGEPHLGNWISGIPAIDNLRLGDQSLLPTEYGEGNKGHNVFYMLPLLLGIIGLLWQALYVKPRNPQRGIEQFWVVCFLFFMTGIAIVLYLNQTPGQPRERDYAFAGSFYAFAIWIGIGVPAISMMLRSLFEGSKKKAAEVAEKVNNTALGVSAAVACLVAIGVPLQMVSQTWDDHDRSGRYAARDFGMNYLSSVAPNGIIFCNGDNDTFPLWYAQEVEGYRTDVRVVNLSYLTTDWYANQQRIPSYDGAPVPMYARPIDYGYDKLAYSFVYPMKDTVTTARESLQNLYASPRTLDQAVMIYPKVYMPLVDTAAVMERFGVDTVSDVSLRYKLPYLKAPATDLSGFLKQYGKGGMNLGNTLSLDFIANSVENNFERPVYFAATVPSSYYLGLSPYMCSTGMASMVTPFAGAPVSPLVDTAYENIMGKFRWGGLDIDNPESLYLDETVRRMVSSTRSSMLTVAIDLVNSGDLPASEFAKENAKANGLPVPETRYDMARLLMHMMLDKLPAAASYIDGQHVVYFAQTFYDLYVATGDKSDLDTALALVDNNIGRFAEFTRYVETLTSGQRTLLSYDLDNVNVLASLIALKNRINVLKALESKPDQAELLSSWKRRGSYDLNLNLAIMLYADGMDEARLSDMLPGLDGSYRQLVSSALSTLEAHRVAGIAPMALTDSLAAEYGFNVAVFRELL